jgi:hypothetical protein
MSIQTDSASPGFMLFLYEQTFQAWRAAGLGFVSEVIDACCGDVRLIVGHLCA